MICPSCKSDKTIKNGHIHNGKQRLLCKACGRQFVPHVMKKVIGEETKAQIDKLLLEKIPLAGIARAMSVSQTWLQSYVNRKYAEVDKHIEVEAKKGHYVVCYLKRTPEWSRLKAAILRLTRVLSAAKVLT